MSEDLYYVSYGSNLDIERFRIYLPDFTEEGNPIPFLIPFRLFFAREKSKTWGYGGTAFIDVDSPGCTYGRAYKITSLEFAKVKHKEGSYYRHEVYLGILNGIPCYTLSCDEGHKEKENKPSDAYSATILAGLEQTYKLSDEELVEYLYNRINGTEW